MDLLEKCRVLPDLDIFYISSYLSDAKQIYVRDKIYALDKKWIYLKNRRLQAHPSELLNGNTLTKTPLSAFLYDALRDLSQYDLFTDSPHKGPNHVLINEYEAGQGIDIHEDGDVYHPIVVTISLGSHCVYNLYRKQDRVRVASVLQEPGSCLITMGRAYEQYLHGIDEIKVDTELSSNSVANWQLISSKYQKATLVRDTRISLTYRDVIRERSIFKLSR